MAMVVIVTMVALLKEAQERAGINAGAGAGACSSVRRFCKELALHIAIKPCKKRVRRNRCIVEHNIETKRFGAVIHNGMIVSKNFA